MRRAATLAATAAAAEVVLIHLGRSFGSTPGERARALPGDELIARPAVVTDHAVTIDAPPAAVWPWLVQMGWHRGGWYTARWVDRLLFPANWPSASRVIPELQHLAVGDFIPDGAPDTGCGLIVESFDPERHLVLHSTSHLPRTWRDRGIAALDWSWAFVLDAEDGGRRTRFHFRSRWTASPWWLTLSGRLALVPADFIMARDMLNGVKTRAEVGTPRRSRARFPARDSGSPPSGRQQHVHVPCVLRPWIGCEAKQAMTASGTTHKPSIAWVARHPFATFVLVAYGFSWSLWGLASVGGGTIPFLLGVLGPMTAACLVTHGTGGSLRAWLTPALAWRTPIRWWDVSLVLQLMGSPVDWGARPGPPARLRRRLPLRSGPRWGLGGARVAGLRPPPLAEDPLAGPGDTDPRSGLGRLARPGLRASILMSSDVAHTSALDRPDWAISVRLPGDGGAPGRGHEGPPRRCGRTFAGRGAIEATAAASTTCPRHVTFRKER